MRFGQWLGCILASAALAGCATGESPGTTRSIRPDLSRCPASVPSWQRLPADAWQSLPSVLAEHRALRSRWQAEMPDAPTMVLVYSQAAHHLTDTFSTTAVRQPDGGWKVEIVGEESSGLLTIEPRAKQTETRWLRGRQARRLDALLADRCLDAEPTYLPHQDEIGAGAMFHTMEILTPGKHRVVEWTLRLRGVNGAIADLVVGRARD
jgi:hypothetical protein